MLPEIIDSSRHIGLYDAITQMDTHGEMEEAVKSFRDACDDFHFMRIPNEESIQSLHTAIHVAHDQGVSTEAIASQLIYALSTDLAYCAAFNKFISRESLTQTVEKLGLHPGFTDRFIEGAIEYAVLMISVEPGPEFYHRDAHLSQGIGEFYGVNILKIRKEQM
jgi:hypothetical protein